MQTLKAELLTQVSRSLKPSMLVLKFHQILLVPPCTIFNFNLIRKVIPWMTTQTVSVLNKFEIIKNKNKIHRIPHDSAIAIVSKQKPFS